MGNTNIAKAEQLGMPAGTAAGKLRKQLLFKYVQLAGDGVCYVCEDSIESVDDFTIEHIKPWFNRNPELFWDLDNIAFSHTRCNRPHNKNGGRPKKEGPEGTAWCSLHQDFVSTNRFWKSIRRWNGYYFCCIDCYENNSR